jgi:uncharacterized RDD family membrane protein YckC
MAIAPALAAPIQASVVLPHYAGFWIRVLSATIDFALLFFANWPVRILVNSAITAVAMNSHPTTQKLHEIRRSIFIPIAMAIGWAYRAGMESSTKQGTLGKLAIGLKVTDELGNRISLARATARYFAKFLSLLSLGIGYLMAGFDARKQALHDRIAGTMVLYRLKN